MTGPRIGSLFSGTGALDLGVMAVLGGSVAWHVEYEKAPSKILHHWWPEVPNYGDVTKVDWSAVEPVDILTGGSPCQDLSHAGKRGGMTEGTRSNLWVAMREAIAQLRPSLVVWENVEGAASATADSEMEPCAGCLGGAGDGGPSLRALGRVVGDLSSLGYVGRVGSLRAADVGAPHGRRRRFLVAYTSDNRLEVQRLASRTPATLTGHLGGRSHLLPTPRTSDTNGAGAHGDGGLDLRTAVSLLPTPRATRGGSNTETASLLPAPRGATCVCGHPVADHSPRDGLLCSDPSCVNFQRGERCYPATPAHLLPTPAVNDEQQRILDRSEVESSTGCWLWTGWTNEAATPYGRFSVGNVKVYAHRASYEAFIGPIPDGYEVDHLCQSSLCVNPEHLEAVTPEENRDRVTQRRTHCKRGHEFTEENTYWVRPGARACQACRAWQDKVQKARKKGAPEPEPPLLPTPVTNDMGEGKTVDAWDEWTAKMQAAHGNGNGHGKSLAIEAQRLLPTPEASRAGGTPERHLARKFEADGSTRTAVTNLDVLAAGASTDWGIYADAIARWESLTRPAPAPTQPSKKGTPQLSPAFSEWLMGLPEGHVTGVPGLSRNDMLKALGNGVVWQQCAAAVRFLLNVSEVAA